MGWGFEKGSLEKLMDQTPKEDGVSKSVCFYLERCVWKECPFKCT